MKKMILLVFIILITSGCSSNNVVLEDFKVTSLEDKLYGYIICDEKQIIQFDNINTVNIMKNNGVNVVAGDELANEFDANTQKEIDLYKFKISDISNQIQSYKNEIIELQKMKKDNEVEKNEDDSKYDVLESELTNLSNTLCEYQFSLEQLNSQKVYIANFDGQFIINDNIASVISNNKNVEIIVSEDEYGTINFNESFTIYKKSGEAIGTVIPSSVTPFSEKTERGKIAYYKIVLSLELNEGVPTLLENETVYLALKEKEFLLPVEYIYKDKNKIFVNKNGKSHEVKGRENKEYYSITEGLSEGDIIKDYKGIIND